MEKYWKQGILWWIDDCNKELFDDINDKRWLMRGCVIPPCYHQRFTTSKLIFVYRQNIRQIPQFFENIFHSNFPEFSLVPFDDDTFMWVVAPLTNLLAHKSSYTSILTFRDGKFVLTRQIKIFTTLYIYHKLLSFCHTYRMFIS